MLAIVLTGGALVACGDDASDADPGSGKRVAAAEAPPLPPPLPPAPPSRRVAAAKWSTSKWFDGRPRTDVYANSKGVLEAPGGTEIRGWGDRRVRRYVTVLFARMQYDFLTGDMASACKHAEPGSDLYLGVALPGSGSRCPTKLQAYARYLRGKGFKSSPLRFLWVRTYPGVAGIWVEDAKGKRFRVPFVQRGKNGWWLKLGELQPPEALAMPLRIGQRE